MIRCTLSNGWQVEVYPPSDDLLEFISTQNSLYDNTTRKPDRWKISASTALKIIKESASIVPVDLTYEDQAKTFSCFMSGWTEDTSHKMFVALCFHEYSKEAPPWLYRTEPQVWHNVQETPDSRGILSQESHPSLPLLVTFEDLETLSGGVVAKKTIQNRNSKTESGEKLPKCDGKKGGQYAWNYKTAFEWWQKNNFASDIPTTAQEARLILEHGKTK